MDVENAVPVAVNEDRCQDPHETRQTDEPNAMSLAALNERALEARPRRKRSGVDVVGVRAGAPRTLERAGFGTITDHQCHARPHTPRTRRIQDGLEIRPLPRAEHGNRGTRHTARGR